MTQRFELGELVPDFYQALGRANAAVGNTGVDPLIHELVKIRASQLNGCAFCLDMHIADARKLGEEQRRLDVLAGWREAPILFSEAEMAAIAMINAYNRIAVSTRKPPAA
ncbi:carboxymuconolactone decarboxylase family protein [Gulosibacter macacae]|uniref:Carboxymuconolactone decarboxylase family protein n=1 Tax=Gulosibacter macacae TaxID=2488791 RepID=A0A3P3VTE6_9MICO|nr:carboxymuconolactone decarboxylase family protein [Gulosibacter macacae]RRJ86055.1 carboxymuconolactone decarboxylase family protein [Gulosibacter macacae]